MKALFAAVLLLFVRFALPAQSPSPFIHVDQFGYLTNAEKVAVLSDPITGFNSAQSFSPGNVLEVRESTSGNLVFSGPANAWNGGQTHNQSGDRGWWFDFSSVTASGTYYLRDPQNNERSGDFVIGDNPYAIVLKQAGRMFYYNRCGIEKVTPFADSDWTDPDVSFAHTFQDGSCRYVYDSTNASLEKDLSGGWYDAGDFNKYVTFTFETLHNMLWAFEESPQAFGDDWDIPESGNGIPDLLDEIMWELDWLKKMNNADGSTQIKMGSISHSHNTLSPPGLNTDPRYYGPTCSAASITVASIFAHAARVLQAYSQLSPYTLDLENRAETSWDYVVPFLNNSLETACDDGTIKAGDADWSEDEQRRNSVAAAVHLFALTGDNNYDQYVRNNYAITEPISQNWIGPYRFGQNDALFLYLSLPNADPTTSTAIENSLTSTISANNDGFFGQNNNDLYRAQAPDWLYHWGSNRPKAGLGILNMLVNHQNMLSGTAAERESRAIETLHYFHGVNPLGMVHMSNMYAYGGDHCVNQIYHGWFANGTVWDDAQTGIGPAPGFVTGGPNSSFTISSISPPAGQPVQKSYLDFNDGFPNNSWEITEPAIYYQAAYLRLLANFVTSPLTQIENQLSNPEVTLFPTPGTGKVHLIGIEKGAHIEVVGSMGQQVKTIAKAEEEVSLDLSGLANGVYFFRVTDPEKGSVQNLRWVKQ